MKADEKPLCREEWDFSGITDEDLEACFLVEYFRELPGFQKKSPFQKLSKKEKKMAKAHFREEEFKADSQFGPNVTPHSVRYFPLYDQNALALQDGRGKIIAVFDIIWAKPDSEIVEEFRTWIRKYRPSSTVSDRRGVKRNSLLVYLERLAVMRLLHHYRPKEIRDTIPDAWKKLFSEKEYFKERKRAVEVFRRLFPPKKNKDVSPVSWPTKAKRSK